MPATQPRPFLLALLAWCLQLATPAIAHDFWILPSTFHPMPGESVAVALRVGMNLDGDPVPRRPERILRFDSLLASDPANPTPITGEPLADPAGSFTPTSPGLHILAYRSTRASIELDAEKFEAYLREEGLDHIIDRRRADAQSALPAREVYSRAAKSLVLCARDLSARDRAVGLDLELILDTPLALLAPGQPLQATLLLHAQPIEGVMVAAIRHGAPHSLTTARTDAQGRITLTPDAPGLWMLKCVHMDRASAFPDPAPDADWESLWASLTFEIPHPAAHATPIAPDAQPPHYPGFTLVWQDEFNNHGPPDPANWIYELGFVRNQEAQWYQPANVSCDAGLLTIEARRERTPNTNHDPESDNWRQSRAHADYTSGSIKTRGLHQWTFGRFEMRARIDIRQGLWPAFWTVGVARPWPGNGELDILEFFRNTLLANAAWGSSRQSVGVWDDSKTPIADVAHAAGYDSPEAWAAEFHVWRMDWDASRIRFYVDGRLLNEVDLSTTINQDPAWEGGVGGGVNPFHEPQHIILNLAVGATGGDPAPTEFPARFEVDWVRVYQEQP